MAEATEAASKSVPPPPPLYVSLELSGSATAQLMASLRNQCSQVNWDSYLVQRGESDPAHVTLLFSRDLPLDQYQHVIETQYRPHIGTTVMISISGVVYDPICIAAVVSILSSGTGSGPEMLPPAPIADKNPRLLHITLGLTGVNPVYSNTLLTRMFFDPPGGAGDEAMPYDGTRPTHYKLHEPIIVPGSLAFIGKDPRKKPQFAKK